MKLSLIRHGKTEANKKRLYCGQSDISLSEQGRQEIVTLKETVLYTNADIYISSGLARATETLRILYSKEPDVIMHDFMEINFGDFEMKSHDQLKTIPEYQNWIDNIETATCPNGESKIVFENRVKNGLNKLNELNTASVVVVCHGGVISTIIEHFFPGQKNIYGWQPNFGRGYTLELNKEKALSITEI